jgi:hypothetical protein
MRFSAETGAIPKFCAPVSIGENGVIRRIPNANCSKASEAKSDGLTRSSPMWSNVKIIAWHSRVWANATAPSTAICGDGE